MGPMEHIRTPVREIAAAHPAAVDVLYRHQIDFCSRGERPLEEACASRSVPVEQVLAEIADAERRSEPSVDWRARPLDELVDHILDRYHVMLDRQLVETSALLDRAMIDDRSAHAEPLRYLRSVFNGLWAEMSAHMMKEDQIVFPLIRSGEGAATASAMDSMRHEHDDTVGALSRIRHLAEGFAPPADASEALRALYTALQRLERDIVVHMHLENNILFPRALAGDA